MPSSLSSTITSDLSTSDVSEIEDVLGRERIRAADFLGRREIEAAGEDAQALEQPLLVLVQQVVRPRDQRAQRLLALEQHAAAAGEQLEAVVQALVDVLDGQRAHPRGGELQRERNALEAGARARRPPALRARSARSRASAAARAP